MASISPSKIEVVVSGYSRCHSDDLLVRYFIIGYINGDEGVLSINSNEHISDDEDKTIAEENKSVTEEKAQPVPCLLSDCWDIWQYIYAQNPDRRKFCNDMRTTRNIKAGYACRQYQCISNQIKEGLNCEINGISHAMTAHDATDRKCPVGLHLNIFHDTSREELFSLLIDTDWNSVPQLQNERNGEYASITVMLSVEMWVTQCKRSFEYVDSPLIPVINDAQSIEWIKIISVQPNDIYVGNVGISFVYNSCNNKWRVKSIYFDRDDIYNKHQLSGMRRDGYDAQLADFKTNISAMTFANN